MFATCLVPLRTLVDLHNHLWMPCQRSAHQWNLVSNFHRLFGDLGNGCVLDLLRTVCRQRRSHLDSSQRLVLLHECALRQNGPSLLEIAISAAHLCHFTPYNAHVIQLCVFSPCTPQRVFHRGGQIGIREISVAGRICSS